MNLEKYINGLPYDNTEEMYKYHRRNSRKIHGSNKNRYRLHPDRINNGKFWELLEKKFGCDPVCPQAKNREEANLKNHNLFANLGGYSAIVSAERYRQRADQLNVLDVGAGYNFTYHHIFKDRPRWNHYAIDVYPKDDRVIKITDEYNLAGNLPDIRFDLIICSNVFQHLSDAIRRSYCKQFYDMMNFNGVFHLNPIYHKKTKIYLYGQQTETIDNHEAMALTKGGFDYFSIGNQPSNGMYGINFLKPFPKIF